MTREELLQIAKELAERLNDEQILDILDEIISGDIHRTA